MYYSVLAGVSESRDLNIGGPEIGSATARIGGEDPGHQEDAVHGRVIQERRLCQASRFVTVLDSGW